MEGSESCTTLQNFAGKVKTLWRWSLSCQWSTVNDINAKFRRHVETTLLFLLSTRLPPTYLPTNQPTSPTPHRVVATSRYEPTLYSTLTWLCFSFYQVASFPCIASPISLSRLGSTKGIPRLGLLYPLKRFSRTLMKKAFSVGQSLLLDSRNILPPWLLHSSATPSPPPLLNSAYFLPYLSIYKYHLDFVPPPVLGQSGEKI